MAILDEILASSRRRVDRWRREWTPASLRDEPLFARDRLSLAQALRRGDRVEFGDSAGMGDLRFLCEIKRASPSAGPIALDAVAVETARQYREAGASGISFLTEPDYFGGRIEELPEVREQGLPVLMKDFLVDPYQAVLARARGADAVLLIAAVGDRPLLREIRDAAREHGLEVLVEIHQAGELDLALSLDPEMLGVNNRDLRTFETDLAVCESLFPHLPDGRVRVAESGIRERPDVERVSSAGYDAVLVGEGLMRTGRPGAALRRLRGADS